VLREARILAALRPTPVPVGFELIDVLSDLQAVDLDAAGLATMRRGTPYLERQIGRWNAQWKATASRVTFAADVL
jgi:aminoglycoside phosphotransferase (APT) family kinase protein